MRGYLTATHHAGARQVLPAAPLPLRPTAMRPRGCEIRGPAAAAPPKASEPKRSAYRGDEWAAPKVSLSRGARETGVKVEM